MSITLVGPYKLLEEDVFFTEDIDIRLATLLFDLSGDEMLTRRIATNMQSAFQDAERITFISAYKNQITPKSFVGLAMVKWTTPDEEERDLEVSDYCFPLFVAHKDIFENAVTEILEKYIYMKAKSQQYTQEITRDLFDE